MKILLFVAYSTLFSVLGFGAYAQLALKNKKTPAPAIDVHHRPVRNTEFEKQFAGCFSKIEDWDFSAIADAKAVKASYLEYIRLPLAHLNRENFEKGFMRLCYSSNASSRECAKRAIRNLTENSEDFDTQRFCAYFGADHEKEFARKIPSLDHPSAKDVKGVIANQTSNLDLFKLKETLRISQLPSNHHDDCSDLPGGGTPNQNVSEKSTRANSHTSQKSGRAISTDSRPGEIKPSQKAQ